MKRFAEAVRPALSNAAVVLIGRHSMQNSVLAALVREQLGCACEVRGLYQMNGTAVPFGALALLDVEGMPVVDIEGCLDALYANESYRGVALFNVDEAKVGEFVLPGVKGVFFRDVSPAHLIKGIRAVFAGEYWLPRRVLEAHFARSRPERVRFNTKSIDLTPKESETLRLLMHGNGNNAIALHLGVSPHTVKTHVYNLFRKLGVKNRVQAVNWAMLNAERVESRSITPPA